MNKGDCACHLLRESLRLKEEEISKLNHDLLICRMERDELKSISDNAHDLIQGVNPEGEIIYVNKAWLENLGYAESEVIGKSIFEIIAPDCQEHCLRKFGHLLAGGKELVNLETEFLTKSGQGLIAEGNVVLVERVDGSFITRGIFRDVTQKRELEKNNLYLATYDSLTGLLNRRAFVESLNRDLDMAKRYGQKIAILFADLDRFKQINDGFGHAAGDAILAVAAARIKGCMRNSDLACRIGGDEFGLVLNNIVNKDDAMEVVNRLSESIAIPIVFKEQILTVGVSIGCVIYPDDGLCAKDLLALADAQMYAQKKEHKKR